MNIKQVKEYFNTSPIEFVPTNKLQIIKEDNSYVPRFQLKNAKKIEDLPINEPLKPTEEIIRKAIKYGMIFLINYKGEKDPKFMGSERVIYPMVFGRSSKGNLLIRGYHLNGWSVSNNRHVEKIWRMFRFDRILSMTFTGSFYRLPPSGYNMNDKGMRGGIITRADFNEIRKNQQTLVKAQEIQNRNEVTIDPQRIGTIRIKSTNTQIDLNKPMENPYISRQKDLSTMRITFLRSLYTKRKTGSPPEYDYVAVFGLIGKKDNQCRLKDEKNNDLGTYRVLDSIVGDVLRKIKLIKGNPIFNVYIFEEKQ